MRAEFLVGQSEFDCLDVFLSEVVISDVEEMQVVGVLDEKAEFASGLMLIKGLLIPREYWLRHSASSTSH